MKPQHLIMTVGVALLALVGQANAEEKALGKHQVPKAVTEAFEKAMSPLIIENYPVPH